jgi:hypothetical protein
MTSIQLSFKDAVYITIYIVTVVSMLAGFKHQIKTLQETIGRMQKLLYHDQGTLNVIDIQTCKQKRDAVYTAIRKGEQITDDIRKEMKTLNENVLRIMIHLQIDTKKEII